MTVQRMSKEDLEQVCELEKTIFSMPWSYQSFMDSLEKKENIYLVAVEDKEVIGYCGVWVIEKEGQINNIAVKRECRNQGVGNHILQALLEEGKKQEIEQFTLEVRKSNKHAIALYEKNGFSSLGIRPNFYEKPQEDAIIMTVITARNG